MKPETIQRRAAKAAVDRAAAKATRIERLTALVARDGGDSIWAEMLREERA